MSNWRSSGLLAKSKVFLATADSSGHPCVSALAMATRMMTVGLALVLSTSAHADPVLAPARLANTALLDPAQEAAAKELMGTLRCLVCQGQSIADSDADLAGDMRALVRERIHAGQRPEAIRRWLVSRYGDYVSYNPLFSGATALLWLTPFAILIVGAWLAKANFRRRSD